MGEETFDLTKDSKLIIYGCGDIGRRVAQELIDRNYHVYAFVDQSAEKIVQWKGIPVIDIEAISKIDKICTYVALVMLNNGMTHESVAKNLYYHGVCKIIYVPMHMEHSYECRRTMRRFYKHLLDYEFANIKDVPHYNIEEPDKNDAEYRIIDDSSDGVISFWCPVDLIRIAENIDSEWFAPEYREYAYPEFVKYQGCLLSELVPYTDLFRWLRGEDVDLKPYLRMTGRYSEDKRQPWLESRKELFLIYEDALKYDLTFFTDAPSACTWDPKGCFISHEGKTRASYLISVGYKFVPVWTTKEDYRKWREFKRNSDMNR